MIWNTYDYEGLTEKQKGQCRGTLLAIYEGWSGDSEEDMKYYEELRDNPEALESRLQYCSFQEEYDGYIMVWI